MCERGEIEDRASSGDERRFILVVYDFIYMFILYYLIITTHYSIAIM